jgi:hypothetical protein
MTNVISHCELTQLQLQELYDLLATYPTWISTSFTVDNAFKFGGTKEKQKQEVPH